MADLIDRAALLEQLDNLHNHCGHCDGYGYISKDKTMQKVKTAPAVDAVEVKPGSFEWSGEKDEWYAEYATCLDCGAKFMVCDKEDYNIAPTYCPHCGTKLDGERRTDATD